MAKGKLKYALELAGSQHKYQKAMIILLGVAWISMMFVFLSSPFLYMDPLFHCKSRGDQIVHQIDACPMIDECTVIDDFTMTASIGLYCEYEWARILIQSSFPIGSFTGLMIMNLISDMQGRRRAFLIALAVTVVGILLMLVGSSNKNPYLLMISQFMRGFGAQSIMPLCYTLCADFLSDTLRPKAIAMLNSSGGIVSIILGFFYIMKLNWLYFTMIFQLLPFILVLIAFYKYLQQSPYILMDRNDKSSAKQVFHYIAKFNEREYNIKQIDQIIQKQQRDQTNKPSIQNIYNTVKQWKYVKTILILIIVNGIAHMNYLGIAYSFAEVGLGYGYNSMMLGVVQFGSILFVSHVVSNVPRRTGISGFYTLTMLVGLLYFTQFVQDSRLISTLLIGVSRIFSVSANCLIGCLETQAFQVQIQSTAVGLIEGLGLWGAVVAPFIVQFAESIGLHRMAVVALFVSLAIWPPYFLTETFKKKDDKQNNQAEALVRSSQQLQLLNSKQKQNAKLNSTQKQ